jgi:hypothetical protein
MLPHERRQHPRFPFRRALEMQAPWRSMVRGCDVSEGGIAFVSYIALDVGDRVRVTLPDRRDFVLEGKVRFVRDEGRRFYIGVERDPR